MRGGDNRREVVWYVNSLFNKVQVLSVLTEADTLGGGWLPRLLKHADTQLNTQTELRPARQADIFLFVNNQMWPGQCHPLLIWCIQCTVFDCMVGIDNIPLIYEESAKRTRDEQINTPVINTLILKCYSFNVRTWIFFNTVAMFL